MYKRQAFKALVIGTGSAAMAPKVVANLLQLMPLLKNTGRNIFRRLGFQQPEALYDEQVQHAMQSLQTDHPFYDHIESQIVEVQPPSPRFRTKFIESISYIKKTLEHATDIVNKKVLPLVATTKDIVSPRAILNNTVQLSAEARDILIHNPEIITGLFYSVMFYDTEPELHAFINLEIAQDPRLAAAYSALKALVGGAAAGVLSKQVVENLLQLMPLLRRGGINIFRRLGYQKPEALYDAHVAGAIQSLDTDRPFIFL